MREIIAPEQAEQAGIWQYGMISTAQIPFSAEIRKICEENVCRSYGSCWSCPPAVGSLEECRQKCLEYSEMLVFSSCFRLEDSFDYEGMTAGLREFKQVCDRLAAIVRGSEQQFLLLSNEGCFRCAKCTYPERPCRFPDRLYPSIEGYGILVGELARASGLTYNNGRNTVTYFGGLLAGRGSEKRY